MSATIYTHVIILALSTSISGLTLNTGDSQEFVQSSFAALYEVDSGLGDEGSLIDIDLLVPLLREDCGETRETRDNDFSFPLEWNWGEEPDYDNGNYTVDYKERQRYDQVPVLNYYQQKQEPVYQNVGRTGNVYNPLLYHAPSQGRYRPVHKLYPNGDRPVLYRYKYPNMEKVPYSPYLPRTRYPGRNLPPVSRPVGYLNLDARRLPNTRYLQMGRRPGADPRNNRPPIYHNPGAWRPPNTRYLPMPKRPIGNMPQGQHFVNYRPVYPMQMHKLPKYNGLDRPRILNQDKWNPVFDRGRHFVDFANLPNPKHQGLAGDQIPDEERQETMKTDPLKENGHTEEPIGGKQNVKLFPETIGKLEHQKEEDQKEGVNERENNEVVETQPNSPDMKESEGEKHVEEAAHKEEESQPNVVQKEEERTQAQIVDKEEERAKTKIPDKQEERTQPKIAEKGEVMKEEEEEEEEEVEEVTGKANEAPKVANKQMMTAEREHPEKNINSARNNLKEGVSVCVPKANERPMCSDVKFPCGESTKPKPTTVKPKNEDTEGSVKENPCEENEDKQKVTPKEKMNEGTLEGVYRLKAKEIQTATINAVTEVTEVITDVASAATSKTRKRKMNPFKKCLSNSGKSHKIEIGRKKFGKSEQMAKQDNTDRDFEEEKQRSKTHAMCLVGSVIGALVVLYFVVGWFYWSLVWKKAYLSQEPPPYYDRMR